MRTPRRLGQLLGVGLVLAAGLVVSLWYSVYVRKTGFDEQARPTSVRKVKGSVDESGSRIRQAKVLAAGHGFESIRRLIEAYGEWADDPSALDARKIILEYLFREENVGAKLGSVLGAIEADKTPPEEDPLWSDIVERLAAVWEGQTLTRGLDLMFAEQRPRARRALVSSFAYLVNSSDPNELTPSQTQTMINYFIDLYGQLPPSQQPEVEAALRTIAGNDVADVLLGRGLTPDDELEGESEYKRALEETRHALAQAQQGRSQTGDRAQ